MSKISGQSGAAPAGPKQNAMPVNHKRSVKVAPAVNHVGGSHPAARRALGAKASARAVQNTTRNATEAMQDTSMNLSNAMNQDQPPSGTAADIASPSAIGSLGQY